MPIRESEARLMWPTPGAPGDLAFSRASGPRNLMHQVGCSERLLPNRLLGIDFQGIEPKRSCLISRILGENIALAGCQISTAAWRLGLGQRPASLRQSGDGGSPPCRPRAIFRCPIAASQPSVRGRSVCAEIVRRSSTERACSGDGQRWRQRPA